MDVPVYVAPPLAHEGASSALLSGSSESHSRKLKLVNFFPGHTPSGDGLVAGLGSNFDVQSYGVLSDKAFADIGDSAGWDSVVRGLRASPLNWWS